jgi:hypothetical protein
MTSKAIEPAASSAAVRHTPLTAMLSPGCTSVHGTTSVIRRKPVPSEMLATRTDRSTMPVNMIQ